MQSNSGSFFISNNTSHPFFLGMFRSSRTIAGRETPAYFPCWRRKANASSPFAATLRLMRTALPFRASRVNFTSPGWSSASNTSNGCSATGVLICFLSPGLLLGPEP